jgi:hypothetical protein
MLSGHCIYHRNAARKGTKETVKHKPEKKKVPNPEKNKEHGKENEPSLQVLATTLQEADSDHEVDLIHLLP